jgi:hypothetical protein
LPDPALFVAGQAMSSSNNDFAKTPQRTAKPVQLPPPPPPPVAPAPMGVAGRSTGGHNAPPPQVVTGTGAANQPPFETAKWRGVNNGHSRVSTQAISAPPQVPTRSRPAVAQAAIAAESTDEDSDSGLRRPLKVADFAPSWLISLVIHLVFLVLLALFVTPAGEGISRVLLTLGQAETEAPADLAEFVIAEETILSDPTDSMTLDAIVDIDALKMSDVAFDSLTPDFAELEMGIGKIELPQIPMVGGRSGSMRKTLLAIYGGTQETEDAVELGLRWLRKQQKGDGSWSLTGRYGDGATSENAVAATSMALLAFLGAGNTHEDGEHKEAVGKAIRWLIKQQDRDGFFARDGRSHQQSYAQAQATIAVCELYAMTNDSWLRDRAQLALKYAELAQADRGGWRYQPREPGDTSVTGWYVMALESGRSGGLEVDQSTFYKVRDFLDSVQHDDGSQYSYQPYGPPTAPMSAEGLLCRQYLGWEREEKALVRGVTKLTTDWAYNRDDPNFYYWYYATQVLHHYGGSPWRTWNEEMRVHLPSIQVKSGAEAGSWAPQRDRWGSSGGRLYTTCFAIYCLEVYYRHMPLYKPTADDGTPR